MKLEVRNIQAWKYIYNKFTVNVTAAQSGLKKADNHKTTDATDNYLLIW